MKRSILLLTVFTILCRTAFGAVWYVDKDNSSGIEVAASLALSDHVLSVADDADGDFLTDSEEEGIGYDSGNPDEDSNGVPDGVDLALETYGQVSQLDWYREDWLGGPPSDPPDIADALPTDRMYAIRFDYMCDCQWMCAVCEEGITIGHLQIVNPNLHAEWQDGFVLPLDAWHYLEWGSFSYSSADDSLDPHEGRVDVVSLLQILSAWEVVFVDKDNVSGPWDGTSWATAFTTIQEGIDAAADDDGGEVWVAEGVYDEERDNDTGSVLMLADVHLYGGFAGTETERGQRDWETHVTTIDGSTARAGEPAYHVIVGADDATLDGFVITGGHASGTEHYELCGAGMFNLEVAPTVRHCTFSENRAIHGGGMYNEFSAPTVIRCTFANNTADSAGGGMHNALRTGANWCSRGAIVTDCRFAGNSADGYGGGIFNDIGEWPAISNCTFVNNTATGGGGGMCTSNFWDFNCDFRGYVQHCTFSGNEAEMDGGGMYLYSPLSWIPEVINLAPTDCKFSENAADRGGGMFVALEFGASPNVARCQFYGNSARVGGGIFNEGRELHEGEAWDGYMVTNCVFAGNTAQEEGGGMANGLISPRVTNCTFSGNAAGNGGGMYNEQAASPVVRNCILWDDWPEEIASDDDTSNPEVTFSDIQGGYPGEGNIDLDPLFADPASDDLRPRAASPCIDAGSADDAPETDIVGVSRPQGGGVDMGAYELAVVVDAEWIHGEVGPPLWTVRVTPTGSGHNTVHISGPTGTFLNESAAAQTFGGMPVIRIDHESYSIRLAFEGALPQPLPTVLDPVCGLEAELCDLEEGFWRFYAAGMNPPGMPGLVIFFGLGAATELTWYPVYWVDGEETQWHIEPADPTPYHLVQFAGPTPTECTPCQGSWNAGGFPALAIDSDSQLIELQFLPWLDGDYPCLMDCPGVSVLEGEFGYLSEGDWHFFCADSYAPFSIEFAVGTPGSRPRKGGRGGSGAPCFIATAAYGTPAAKEVSLLRGFRDRYLLTNRAGAAFVRAYYRFSPSVARFVATREPVRAAVRVCLAPIVALARLILTFPLSILAAGFLTGAAIALSRLRQNER